jgi:hypothetical protein
MNRLIIVAGPHLSGVLAPKDLLTLFALKAELEGT